jgi:hypothetical protein
MSKNQKLKVINKVNNNTLMEHLNIEFTDVGNDYLTCKNASKFKSSST